MGYATLGRSISHGLPTWPGSGGEAPRAAQGECETRPRAAPTHPPTHNTQSHPRPPPHTHREPVVRLLALEAVGQGLAEHAVLVAQAVAPRRQVQRRLRGGGRGAAPRCRECEGWTRGSRLPPPPPSAPAPAPPRAMESRKQAARRPRPPLPSAASRSFSRSTSMSYPSCASPSVYVSFKSCGTQQAGEGHDTRVGTCVSDCLSHQTPKPQTNAPFRARLYSAFSRERPIRNSMLR